MIDLFTVNSKNLAFEQGFRFDEKYVRNQNKQYKNYYKFSDLFDVVLEDSVDMEELSESFYYCQIGDTDSFGNIYPVHLDFSDRSLEHESYYKKIEKNDIIKPKLGDILISKIRPNLKKIIYIDESKKNVYFTKAFLHLRAKDDSLLSYYLLRIYFINEINSVTRMGKGYPVINEKDIRNVKVSKELLDKIYVHKNKIKEYIKENLAVFEKNKDNITEQDIIDKKFDSIFNFDLFEFEKLKKQKNFYRSSRYMGINSDLRISAKFNRYSAEYVENELREVSYKKLKKCISEPIVQGATIRDNNYDSESGYYYISMGSFRTWRVNYSDLKEVEDEYYTKNERLGKTLEVGDIIFARSGEGTIGKVAIVDKEVSAIFSDFVLRIRSSNSYESKFLYYYFRTTYFQYLIEVYKKGLGNNTNIFPSALNDFPVPVYPLKNQREISDQIDDFLNIRQKNISDIENFDKDIETFINSLD